MTDVFAIIPGQLSLVWEIGFINVISTLGTGDDYSLPSEHQGIHCVT